jgi:hypothetical protein
MAGYRAAIDFGTSYTVATSQAGPQAPPTILALVDEGRLSSAVALDDAGRARAGPSVEDVAALAPDRVERTPKRCLDQPDVMLGGQPVQTVDLVAAVLEYVRAELLRQFNGLDPDELCMTHPARWEVGDPKMQRLEAAARQAGFAGLRLLPEPCAAALALAAVGQLDEVGEGELVAVYDLGGGTFDIALLSRVSGEGFELTGEPGGDQELGGEWLDDRLYERLTSQLPADDEVSLRDPGRSPDPLLWRRAGFAFRQGIRRAKERLSREVSTQIALYPPFSLDRLSLTRAELELTAIPLVNKSADRFDLFLKRNGRRPADLAAICLVGGSSRLTVVNRIIGERFGCPVATYGDPKAVTALGALSGILVAAPHASAKSPMRPGFARQGQSPGSGTGAPGAARDRTSDPFEPIPGDRDTSALLVHAPGLAYEPSQPQHEAGGIVERPKVVKTFRGNCAIHSLAFSPDRRFLAISAAERSVLIWNATAAKDHLRLPAYAWAVLFSADGRWLISVGTRTAQIWDTATGKLLLSVTHRSSRDRAVALSPDSRWLATGSPGHGVRIWGTADGRALMTISLGPLLDSSWNAPDGVDGLAFSPDGRRLATASTDNTARIWDAATGQPILKLAHGGAVSAVAFSPDGRRLATASTDKTARIWDAVTGQVLAELPHQKAVRDVAFSPDGDRLATATKQSAQVWALYEGSDRDGF